MRIEDVKLMFDYNYWATSLILSKSQALSNEQHAQPTTCSWNSLLGTLIHMLDSEYIWRILCETKQFSGRLVDQQSFATLAQLQDYWQQEEALMRAYLDHLTDAEMDSIVRYEIPEGVRERVLWHCLLHVVNHGTQHRSECAAMLTDMGHSPGDIDFTRFLNERNG